VKPELDEGPIFDLMSAHMQTRLTEIGLRLGLFEALRQAKTLDELRLEVSIGRRAVEVLTTALASFGLVLLTPGERAELTALARAYLLEESPFYKGDLFALIAREEMELLRKVYLQDGQRRAVTSQWLAGRVRDPQVQGSGTHANTFAAACALSAQLRFTRPMRLLDVGGGVGSFSIALALNHPEVRCVVLDLPQMEQTARQWIERYRLGDRVDFIGTDMFGDWPRGQYDAVVFSNVLHNWPDRRSELLAKAFAHLPSGGRLLVQEVLLDDAKDGPRAAALWSAMILLEMDGQQMSLPELSRHLQAAGFGAAERVATFGAYSLVSAEKAG
jgi:acetylserotonin N-methyltransferase